MITQRDVLVATLPGSQRRSLDMRILVTGDRDWTDYQFIYEVLRELQRLHLDKLVMTTGLARGADLLSNLSALNLGIQQEGPNHPSREFRCGEVAVTLANFDKLNGYAADWDTQHKGAGPIRNRKMYKEFKPNLVVAFHDNLDESRGTKDMVAVAEKGGTPVWHYRHVRELIVRAPNPEPARRTSTRAVPIPRPSTTAVINPTEERKD